MPSTIVATADALYGFKFRCSECCAARGKTIEAARLKHAVWCTAFVAPALRLAVTDAQRSIAAQGSVSAVLTDDEIVDAVRAGELSTDSAMNRDF